MACLGQQQNACSVAESPTAALFGIPIIQVVLAESHPHMHRGHHRAL
jgi:hypothetical protein